MLSLITRRIVATVVTLFLISVVAFILIQLPPGDFVDAYAGKKTQGGVIITQEELDVMRTSLGIDQPFSNHYLRWSGGGVNGDVGFSW
jgi:peptide/nickel transport system permease protein